MAFQPDKIARNYLAAEQQYRELYMTATEVHHVYCTPYGLDPFSTAFGVSILCVKYLQRRLDKAIDKCPALLGSEEDVSRLSTEQKAAAIIELFDGVERAARYEEY